MKCPETFLVVYRLLKLTKSRRPAGPFHDWPNNISDSVEPPVADGCIRLYRGVKPQGFDSEFSKVLPLSDYEQIRLQDLLEKGGEQWSKSEREEFEAMLPRVKRGAGLLQGDQPVGLPKFYGDELKTAKNYAGPKGKIIYIDVPIEEVGAWRQPTLGMPGSGEVDYGGSFSVPWDYASRARESVHSPTNGRFKAK